MKKIILLFVIFSSAISFGQWSYVSNIPGFANINCISVVDQNLIWACGDSRAVCRTTNGGVNWVTRNNGLPSTSINSISALDTTLCWIGTVTGSIYNTTDGGNSWTLQFSIAGSFSNGIKMFDQNYGLYYGDPTGAGQPHQWRYTINGGANWLLSTDAPIAPANEYGLLNAWDWIDTGRIWIATGNLVSGATTARILKTLNGFRGGGWTPAPLTGTGNSDGLYFSSIAFTDANNGMAACNGSGNAIRKTTDGGNNWTVVTNPPGLSNFIPFNMCGLKDGSNLVFAFIYTNTNYCVRTSDFGVTWVNEPLPTQAQTGSLRLMKFVNSSLGYAGGFNGVFLRYGNSIGISQINSEIPTGYVLGQNYPNPFNPSTKINFSLPRSSDVTIRIYNGIGKEVETLINEFKPAGNYSVDYTAAPGLTSGVYFYSLTANDFRATKKLMIVK
ncbi:MAG: T9SS type A sorting domain-containing protein [Ignavibacteria bacterium]